MQHIGIVRIDKSLKCHHFIFRSDGRMVGLDRNRSYNLGPSILSQGLALLGRNVSADRSDKTEPPKLDRVHALKLNVFGIF